MFSFFDPFKAAQTTRMNNVIELAQQSKARATNAYQRMEDSYRRTIRGLEDELDEFQRARSKVVAERNALRDQVASLQRQSDIQAQALLHAFAHVEGLLSTLKRLHTLWAPPQSEDQPFKTLEEVFGLLTHTNHALKRDELWKERTQRAIDTLCARIAEESACQRG